MFVKTVSHRIFPGSEADFVLKDNFIIRFMPVNISYLGKNVRDVFWDKVIEPMGVRDIFAYKLGKNTSTRELVDYFGGGDASSFVVIWNLLLDQPYGQDGYLFVNGRTNIFLGFDYSIGVFWYKKGWSIRAYPANAVPERIWYADNQVIVLK